MVGAVAWGSTWGTDDAWPFAPFRMYATATRLDGRVLKASFVGVTAEGERIDMPAGWLGLRPAEVEGQRDLSTGELPAGHLEALAAQWNATHETRLVALELHLKGRRLEDGRPTERLDETVDVWVDPDHAGSVTRDGGTGNPEQ